MKLYKSPSRKALVVRHDMSDAPFDSAITDQLPRDLLVTRLTASDSTRVLGDLGKTLAFGDAPKSARNGLFVPPHWASPQEAPGTHGSHVF